MDEIYENRVMEVLQPSVEPTPEDEGFPEEILEIGGEMEGFEEPEEFEEPVVPVEPEEINEDDEDLADVLEELPKPEEKVEEKVEPVVEKPAVPEEEEKKKPPEPEDREFAHYTDFDDLLHFNNAEYREMRGEVKMFFNRNKNKKFGVYIISTDYLALAGEYYNKVRPIMQFIYIRGMFPGLTKRMERIFQLLNREPIDKYITILSSKQEYGKSLVTYKLNNCLNLKEGNIRKLVTFFFNVQPIKERLVSSNTVGLGQDEMADIMSEDE